MAVSFRGLPDSAG